MWGPGDAYRAAGRWPDSYDMLWGRLRARHGKEKGGHAMIMVLLLGQEFRISRPVDAITSG
jgi:hypothetical protein